MAEKGSEGSALGAIAGVSGFAIWPIIAIVLFFGISGSAHGATTPTPGGAEPGLKTNPNPVTAPSAIAKELGDYQRFTDVNGYLVKNSPLSSSLQSTLTSLLTKLPADTPYTANGATISVDNVNKIRAIIPQMIADLNAIQTQVNANTPQNAARYTTDLVNNLQKLQNFSLSASPQLVATIAQQIATTNNNGKGAIGFANPDLGQHYNYNNGMIVAMDCSGFVSYVLQKAGIFHVGETGTTVDFATTYESDHRFQVIDSTAAAISIPESQIAAEAQPGDIFVSSSDNLVSISNNDNHSFIYLGAVTGLMSVAGIPDGTLAVAESTDGSGKNGPQFDTLDNRAKHHGHIQLILRPVAGS